MSRTTSRAGERDQLAGLVGGSAAMKRIFAAIEALAAGDATVLVLGESGVGKRSVARAIHQLSSRADQPFVVLDCAGANPELLESRLFDEARGGTLLLDEVAMLPLALQARVQKLLESGEYRSPAGGRPRKSDARVLASSQRDLDQLVKEGTFREDLFYRLAASVVQLPPLRERRDDIAALAQHFANAGGFEVPLSDSTLAALINESWRGNARELRDAVERAFALGAREPDGAVEAGAPSAAHQRARAKVLASFERDYLRALLARHPKNVSAAAREAGLARGAFCRLLDKHELS